MPGGMKVKEKTVRGSARPVGGTCTLAMMPWENLPFFQQQTPTGGTSTPMMMPGQNLPFFQQKPA